MKIFSLLLLLPVVLAACTNPITEIRPIRLTSKDIAGIQMAVKYDLIEPESAKFRNFRAAEVVRQDGKVIKTVCGEVNSKNRLGGFSGNMPFSAELTPTGTVLRGVESPTDKVGFINSFYCNPVFGENWRKR
tara:strand:- start:232 stop:627 length:396 start_codon:yes stop_codon:yes gene_type:complete